MARRITRREFIRIAGLTTVGAAMVPLSFDLLGKPDSTLPPGVGPDGIYPTYCEICFWKCAGWTHVKDGEPYKITGSKEDPLCNGRLCPRGTGGIGMYQDEDRLKHPLIRVEKDGKQTFRKASWDEALDFIANKLEGIITVTDVIAAETRLVKMLERYVRVLEAEEGE